MTRKVHPTLKEISEHNILEIAYCDAGILDDGHRLMSYNGKEKVWSAFADHYLPVYTIKVIDRTSFSMIIHYPAIPNYGKKQIGSTLKPETGGYFTLLKWWEWDNEIGYEWESSNILNAILKMFKVSKAYSVSRVNRIDYLKEIILENDGNQKFDLSKVSKLLLFNNKKNHYNFQSNFSLLKKDVNGEVFINCAMAQNLDTCMIYGKNLLFDMWGYGISVKNSLDAIKLTEHVNNHAVFVLEEKERDGESSWDISVRNVKDKDFIQKMKKNNKECYIVFFNESIYNNGLETALTFIKNTIRTKLKPLEIIHIIQRYIGLEIPFKLKDNDMGISI